MDNIFRFWERVLRWVYPGGLFFVLFLFSSKPSNIQELLLFDPRLDIALKLLAFFSIGVFIYLMQNLFIRWLSASSICGIRKLFSKSDCRLKVWYLNHVREKIERTVRVFEPETNPTYKDDLWARYHAANISAWLPFIFIICNHDWSNFCLALPISIWLGNLHYYYYIDKYTQTSANEKKKKPSVS